jgi:hypothetical protein
MKGAALLVLTGIAAAGVVEWQGWGREAGIFAALTGVGLGGLVAFQASIMKRLNELEAREKRTGR